MQKLATCIDRGLQEVAEDQEQVRAHVKEVRRIAATLDPEQGSSDQRHQRFRRLQKRLARSGDRVRRQMAVVMAAFQVGLFAGGELPDLPEDNLDLERWFRLPKGHERRIHGHRHAGVRLVLEGATLMAVLDAHGSHPDPFTGTELLAYRAAAPPRDEQEALHRRKVMRQARSKKRRRHLLAELEQRYLSGP